MRRNRRKIRWKIAVPVVVAVLGLYALIAALFYSNSKKIEDKLFAASSENLQNIYGEVSQTFSEISMSRWNYLEGLGDYFADVDISEKNISDMLERMKESYGFTDFYFVSDNGSYITVDGSEGYIDLGTSLFLLVDDRKSIVTDGSLPRRENMIFYAVPVEENTYGDFTYCALAFGYDKEAMNAMLKVNSYGGTESTYITYSNGRVAFSMGTDRLKVKNVFACIEDSSLTTAEIENIENDFAGGSTNTITLNIQGEDYYLHYQSLGFQDWVLVAYIPTVEANRAMNDVRRTTISMVTAILIIIFVSISIILVLLLWRAISRRNSLINERELIFSTISKKMDEIYMLFSINDHEVLYVSPNVERLLGVSEAEIFGDCYVLTECCTDNSKWLGENTLTGLMPGQTLNTEAELMNKTTGQSALYSVSLYRPNGSNDDKALVIIADRTQEQRVRQEIEDALQASMLASQAKSTFLSNMSHDIRTPMNAIVGFTSLLEGNADSPDRVREYAGKIKSSGAHLLGLINDVLDISKIEAGKASLNLEPVDMSELINGLEDIIGPQAQKKHQTFTIDTRDITKYQVMADRLRVSQILINILSNAIKYTPDGGTIRFSARCEDDYDRKFVIYNFVISDNGIGMSEDYQKIIFAPFTRETGSMTNKIQGTGLGMAITKSLTDMMGGTIRVKSERDRGSTFYVTLEFRIADVCDRQKADAEYKPDEPQDKCSLEGMHILAAEDNELNAELLKELLSIRGATCDIAQDGMEVVDMFEKSGNRDYDLILMDVQMPRMNGYEATMAIRKSVHERAQTIPIIAMTANAFAEDVQDALSSGMNAHVAKPIDMAVLERMISGLCGTGRETPSGDIEVEE